LVPVLQLRTIDPNNLMVLLDFRRKLAAGEGGQVCTGPNVAHLPATDGSDGAVDDADEPMPSHGADAAEPEGKPLQRRCTAPATSVGERPNGESDAPDTVSRSPRVVDRIKQTKFRPLTPEQRQQVVDLYRAGVPIKKIVRQTGVNRSTVYRLRGQAGLERSHRFTDDDRAQAILLRQQGLTIAEIAKRLGFSGMTIGRHLAAAHEERCSCGENGASVVEERPEQSGAAGSLRHWPDQGRACFVATAPHADGAPQAL